MADPFAEYWNLRSQELADDVSEAAAAMRDDPTDVGIAFEGIDGFVSDTTGLV